MRKLVVTLDQTTFFRATRIPRAQTHLRTHTLTHARTHARADTHFMLAISDSVESLFCHYLTHDVLKTDICAFAVLSLINVIHFSMSAPEI